MLFFFVVMYPPRYESSYRGKVIDAETGAPIAGAVVLGVWYREYPTVAGGMERYHDAREVVTNANGDFTMPGKGLLILSNIVPARVFIFKAGYEYRGPLGIYLWTDLKEGRPRGNIRWEGEKAIIQLKKLTLAERKKQLGPSRPNIPGKRMQRLTQEINKDRVEQGLEPF
ncbi:MAG TPA: carboxypeptidase-like regulatory domain-containing protein [Candidatus Tectomicrobia bacterium]